MFLFRSELRWIPLYEVRGTSFKVWGYFIQSWGYFVRSSATSYKMRTYEQVNFVQSSGQICTKFGATTFKVRGYFVQSWGSFVQSSATSYKMRMYERVNFVRSSGQLRTNFEPTSCEVLEVLTSHGNIISVATVFYLPTSTSCVCYITRLLLSLIRQAQIMTWKSGKKTSHE